MVSIPNIPCGAPNVSYASPPPTVKITNRDVAVAYPCAREGAKVTFFLFVHGTLQEAQKIPFTMLYATFGEKFDIRSMWAHGGSWGARYLSTFACDAKLEQRLKGVYMVVGGGCPSCSERLSCVVIQEELEKGNGSMLSPMQREMLVDAANIAPYAMQHGCDAQPGPTMVGNVRVWDFPNCDRGWFHAYYLGPGEHADTLDQTAVVKLTEAMKATEP